jgi:hypothetical protein
MERVRIVYNKFFVDHPNENNETYGQHMFQAVCISLQLFWAAVAVLIHAFIPGIFTTTASDCLKRVLNGIASRKQS